MSAMVELLRADQPSREHNGGDITFGPDGADWSNDAIPDTTDPDDFIAPLKNLLDGRFDAMERGATIIN